MTGTEICEYAELTEHEKQIVNTIVDICAKNWEVGKSQFRYGVIAALGYLKTIGEY